jgi:hypothetical protein
MQPCTVVFYFPVGNASDGNYAFRSAAGRLTHDQIQFNGNRFRRIDGARVGRVVSGSGRTELYQVVADGSIVHQFDPPPGFTDAQIQSELEVFLNGTLRAASAS